MSVSRTPGREAIAQHGFNMAHRWLITRRLSQLGFFMLFATGPWFGLWITKGTLASSLTLDVLPLTDPLILLQSFLARHPLASTALVGAAIVLGTYLIVGGRLYCSWVCPINPVTDLAAWTRRRLGIDTDWKVKPETRLWVLGAILTTSALTGTIAFELVNPITTLHRGLLFGASWGLVTVAAIFVLDVFVARHGWCGHLCPVGAFYGLANRTALIRVSATGRVRCDDCMDCYAVCPEMHVISPALKGEHTGASPVVLSADCTACGRCVDVCPERVFNFTHRFDERVDPPVAAGVVASVAQLKRSAARGVPAHKEPKMTRTRRSAFAVLAAAVSAGLLVLGAGVMAQDAAVQLKALGGEKTLEQTNAAPDVEKQSVAAGGFGRAYRQQPPLIPHKVDSYQVTTTNNACMNCHDWPGHIEAKAPKVSETHYVDRQGARLDKISGTRYFCQQCHVPQADAKPLVNNTFQNATQAK